MLPSLAQVYGKNIKLKDGLVGIVKEGHLSYEINDWKCCTQDTNWICKISRH